MAATPRCAPIVVQHSDDVTHRHDSSSPSSTSTSSRESGIKSTTDSSSPEHRVDYFYNYRPEVDQFRETVVAQNIQDDGPLDLSLTSSLPRQRKDAEKAASFPAPAVTSRCPGNDSCLRAFPGNATTPNLVSSLQLSIVNPLPLLSNAHRRDVTHCHGNGNQLSAPLSFLDEMSMPSLSNSQHNVTHYHSNRNQLSVPPLFGNAHCLLQPQPICAQSPQMRALDDYFQLPPSQDASTDSSSRLPEPAKLLLTSWYETHIRHPYPQPNELSQLVVATGQSRRKILKWLANRRARTGNTLPHNGSVHPRKIVKIRQLRQIAETEEPHQRIGPRRGQRSARFLPESVVEGLQRWYDDHLGYPYPTETEKRRLAEELSTTIVKVTNWFANKRNRSRHGKTASEVRRMSSQPSGGLPHQFGWRYGGLAQQEFPRSYPASTPVQTRQWAHLL